MRLLRQQIAAALSLVILVALARETQATSEPVAPDLWTSLELRHIAWRDACIVTTQCGKPRFQIIQELHGADERVATGWPVTPHLVQEHSEPLVSHWPAGSSADWTLAAQVAGIDPSYGFPRVCDETHSARPFYVAPVTSGRRSRRAGDDDVSSDSDERLVELRARCFNATLAVKRHTVRCPWCKPDVKDLGNGDALVAGEDCFGDFSAFLSHPRWLTTGVAALAALALVSTFASFALFVALLRARRRHGRVLRKRRDSTSSFDGGAGGGYAVPSLTGPPSGTTPRTLVRGQTSTSSYIYQQQHQQLLLKQQLQQQQLGGKDDCHPGASGCEFGGRYDIPWETVPAHEGWYATTATGRYVCRRPNGQPLPPPVPPPPLPVTGLSSDRTASTPLNSTSTLGSHSTGGSHPHHHQLAPPVFHQPPPPPILDDSGLESI